MALAIGANTAIFSVADSVLLRPLPFQGSDKLLCVWHGDGQSYTWYTFSFPRFTYFQENLKQLADLAAYDDEVVTLRDKTGPVRLEGGRVSANFFSLLGVRPQLGRSFRPEEDRHGASAVILLSARLWRLRFNADPGVVGTPLVIDGESSTVIGVLPEGFQFTDSAVDVWRSRIVDTRTFARTKCPPRIILSDSGWPCPLVREPACLVPAHFLGNAAAGLRPQSELICHAARRPQYGRNALHLWFG